MALAETREGAQELGNPLGRVDVAEGADHRRASDLGRRHIRHRRGGKWDAPDAAGVALLPRAALGVTRVDDQGVRVVEDLAGERIALGRRLPWRPDAAGGDGLGQPESFLPAVALHGGDVGGGVPARERQPCDEVVEDEVVQDDDAGTAAQRVHDPPVRLRVVADVVDATSVRRGSGRRGRATSTSIRCFSAGSSRRCSRRCRSLRRKRRVVRDLHGRCTRPG